MSSHDVFSGLTDAKHHCPAAAGWSPSYLCSEVRDHYELLENVLGQNVSESSLLYIVRTDIDMVGTEMEVSS